MAHSKINCESHQNILSVSKDPHPIQKYQSVLTNETSQSNIYGSTMDGVSRQNTVTTIHKKPSKSSSLHGRWTDEEHRLFLEGIELFKKDWRSIERHIGTRTCSQIRSHAQKYFLRIERQSSIEGAVINSQNSQTNRSNQDDEDDCPHTTNRENPRFQRMQSAAPILEHYSASKKPSHSKNKTELM